MWELYKSQPSFILGFHGCDEEIGRAVIAGETSLKPSANEYDWLGQGMYFWEGSPHRAWEWAESVHRRRPHFVKRPFALGAVIDLGACFNMTDTDALRELREAYELCKSAYELEGLTLPTNEGGTQDRLLRYLDRTVIEFMHQMRKEPQASTGAPLPAYDTVRSPFLEGGPLYPGSGVNALNHVQVAVRNANCIKGYFLPIRSA